MVIPVLGFIVSLSPLLILGPIGFILALFLFFAGFKGQYKSKKQRNRGIWKAILGLFLPFIPYLFLLIALMNGEEGR